MTNPAQITNETNPNQTPSDEYQARVYVLAPVPNQAGMVTVVYNVVQVRTRDDTITIENEGPMRTTTVSGFLVPEAYTRLTITAQTGNKQPSQILPSQLTLENLFDYYQFMLEHGTLAEYHLVGANDPTGTVRVAYTLRDEFGQVLGAQMQTLTGMKTLAQALQEAQLKLVVKSEHHQQILPKLVTKNN